MPRRAGNGPLGNEALGRGRGSCQDTGLGRNVEKQKGKPINSI